MVERPLARALLFACLGGSVVNLAAASPCGSEGGIGGTGRPAAVSEQDSNRTSPPPTGGIGGTGISAANDQRPHGIVGVITAFASICVNGTEVRYEADTPTEINGKVAASRELERGQMVRVSALQSGEQEYRATHIAVLDAVVGPVTQQDVPKRRFWVMGQPVTLASDAVIAISGTGMPSVGSTVKVSALVAPNGELHASRVEGASSRAPVYLMAPVTQMDGRIVQVGLVKVELPAGAEQSGLQLGQELAVRGIWDGEMVVADAYWLEPKRTFPTQPQHLSLQGYLMECETAGRYALDGFELVSSGATDSWRRYLGHRVVAHGEVGATGKLSISDIKELPSEEIAAQRNPSKNSMRSRGGDRAAEAADDEQLTIRAYCGAGR